MSTDDLNPLGRFSDRVDDYAKFRPGYPAELIAFLRERAGLGPGTRVADVGSGTGIFTAQLLEAGASVVAVEPNDAMRSSAESVLSRRPGFASLKGTAESTGLPAHSVALVTCAQAFHWFDPDRTCVEFRRILSPGGSCAVIWNTPPAEGSDFSAGYERIKQTFGTDFGRIRHENIDAPSRFGAFFGRGNWEKRSFAHFQVLDFNGLAGRLRSSSYAPKEQDPRHGPMMSDLRELFDRCQQTGTVRMEYETELFLGRFDEAAPVGR